MTTYTVAFVPDGTDIEAAVADELVRAKLVNDITRDDWESESGLILTDEAPDDRNRLFWSGHSMGWISDETGKAFEYIVRSE